MCCNRRCNCSTKRWTISRNSGSSIGKDDDRRPLPWGSQLLGPFGGPRRSHRVSLKVEPRGTAHFASQQVLGGLTRSVPHSARRVGRPVAQRTWPSLLEPHWTERGGPRRPSSPSSRAEQGHQGVNIDGLGQEGIAAGVQALLLVALHRVGGQGDDRGLVAAFRNSAAAV